jgi:intracellular septation protein A
LGAIVRHLTLSLLLATIIPSVLFYVCLVVGDVWAALAAALAWCYGAMAWRMGTHRRCSGLLWITAIGLTVKTIFSISTGSTFVYFLQPAVTDVVIAAVFLGSLTSARPVVARLAGDFYPMTADVAARPRVQRLFWHLTLMWAVVCLFQAAVTVWLLETASLDTFVAARTGLTTAMAICATVVTVVFATRIARREGLMRPRARNALVG